MAEARKTSSKKSSSARKTASRKRSTEQRGTPIPIKDRSKEQLKGVGKKASAERQRVALRDCFSSLQRVSDACHPLSVWGVLVLLFVGAAVGIFAFIGTLSVVDSPLLRKLVSQHDRSAITAPEWPQSKDSLSASVADMDEFWEVWKSIEDLYVPQPAQYSVEENDAQKAPNQTDLIHGAIDGLTRSTNDPYTNFFLPKDAEDFENQVIDGEIDGIGAYLTIYNDQLTVAKTVGGGPAAQAGLRSDDVILAIDGVESITYNLSEAAEMIRGPRGSQVLLTIYRPVTDDTFDVTITRAHIEIPTLETEVRDRTFIIHLSTFTRQTPEAFRKALLEYDRISGTGYVDRILLDLRGNMGGILSVAVYTAGLFVPSGVPVLYEYDGSDKLKAYRTKEPMFGKGKTPTMTVLVDSASASASEILAAALKYYGIADIVGIQTLGKGSVQALKNIGDKSLLKITVAHWLTPEKISIGGTGIIPDVDYFEDLQGALEEDPDLDIDEYLLNRALTHLQQK
ncbi:MAG: S41 family peptidase [Candidatus Kaiserbacteria bacterium]|nr:S41 family peptidase [Candidatus Kaiserbacteria bacterium]